MKTDLIDWIKKCPEFRALRRSRLYEPGGSINIRWSISLWIGGDLCEIYDCKTLPQAVTAAKRAIRLNNECFDNEELAVIPIVEAGGES